MSEDRPTLPPVRLHSDASLARDALAAPLFARAVTLARWASPDTRVGAGGELVEEQLPDAAAVLKLGPADGVEDEEDAAAFASEAWRTAVDTGLVDVIDPPESDDSATEGAYGTAAPGEALAVVAGGSPQDVLGLWLEAFDTAFADATAPVLDDLGALLGDDGELDFGALDWDPQQEADFLEGVLGNLYLLTVAAEGPADGLDDGWVPLPALAASMIVPDDMGEPTDDVLEQVSDAMMRLDDQFRVLEPVGLVAYRPVDEALMAEESADAPAVDELDEDDVARYGMVRLTPLGLYGVRARMLEAGVDAPAVGDLAEKGADALLDGIAYFPEQAGRDELEQWLARREPAVAATELLAAARGDDPGAPLRRLRCQQGLLLVDRGAEPSVRAVLDDRELGGLARVWLAERGVSDVPVPPEEMVFWLAVDTIAAQLDAAGETPELQELVVGLVGQHTGFLDSAWRVEHPATGAVLEAMGRLHPEKKIAKEAKKAAFKARSRTGG
ncbi:hypothetical protein OG897_11075 [Streptomyces sp. NBC_00237]|uniref:hypothetical protein n=1 Tax=Streptomyces sp. NBC_00237 TaxID=2975687 RepID=UPI0022560988|nr:hypothetical protein [Streptomyces sp. NBC_00237]MCX5201990.1 hypothetical protein [Streptomyces sp. NBC_00237]